VTAIVTQPKTMDGYVTVSRRLGREGPGCISPRVQREAIERWAEYKGVTIAEWHVDEDETGGTQDRPGLVAAVERTVNGETGGIVSWRIDRFSRYTEGGLRDLRRLQERDARLAFVVEDIDTSGPMGRFVYTVMLAMGEYFLETIKAGWVTAKSKAIARGAHIGPTPFGYTRDDDGTLAIDPQAGPIVSEAFAICARNGLASAIEFLSERAADRTWTTFTARRFFFQRVYLGQVSYGDQVRAGAHEALVTRAIFEAVRQQLGSGERARRAKQDFPLSGVAVCGTCAAPMVGGRGGADARRMYRCSKRCEAPAVTSAVPLEQHVVAFLREAFRHPGMRVGGESADISAAETALLEAEHELDAFASDLNARRLLRDRYNHHLQQRVDAVEQAREQLHAVMAAAEDSAVVVPDELWDDLTPAEVGDVLRSTLAQVVVNRGRGPLGGRVVVLPKGMARPAGASTEDAHEGGL
jgi:DNA invertase Pin-like site-specific DNA recombinase